MEPELDTLQSITLDASWRGGPGVDVVSIVHNGRLVSSAQRTVDVYRNSVKVAYEVERSARHEILVVLSFIGDIRTDLALLCSVDGRPVGGAVRSRRAEHRCELRVRGRSREGRW